MYLNNVMDNTEIQVSELQLKIEQKAGMSPQEKDECAKNFRDMSFEGSETASRRGGELSDEFTRLEVQIATILIGFASLFLSFLLRLTLALLLASLFSF